MQEASHRIAFARFSVHREPTTTDVARVALSSGTPPCSSQLLILCLHQIKARHPSSSSPRCPPPAARLRVPRSQCSGRHSRARALGVLRHVLRAPRPRGRNPHGCHLPGHIPVRRLVRAVLDPRPQYSPRLLCQIVPHDDATTHRAAHMSRSPRHAGSQHRARALLASPSWASRPRCRRWAGSCRSGQATASSSDESRRWRTPSSRRAELDAHGPAPHAQRTPVRVYTTTHQHLRNGINRHLYIQPAISSPRLCPSISL